MADYIESWRICKRATVIERGLRKVLRDKKANVAQRLRACELLIEIERERSASSIKPNLNSALQNLAKANVALGLSRQNSSQEINNLAQSA